MISNMFYIKHENTSRKLRWVYVTVDLTGRGDKYTQTYTAIIPKMFPNSNCSLYDNNHPRVLEIKLYKAISG